MAKPKSVYRCTECGHEHPKWVGRCEACGEWNVVAEEPALARGGKGGKSGRAGRVTAFSASTAPVRLNSITAESLIRWRTGIPEFDFVLGGGIVPGSMTLIGGEPGIGKSTLLLQAAARLEAA
jgi:DNA repair protein RadA/Sms